MTPLNERLDKGASHEAIGAGYRDPQGPALPLVDWANMSVDRLPACNQDEEDLPEATVLTVLISKASVLRSALLRTSVTTRRSCRERNSTSRTPSCEVDRAGSVHPSS